VAFGKREFDSVFAFLASLTSHLKRIPLAFATLQVAERNFDRSELDTFDLHNPADHPIVSLTAMLDDDASGLYRRPLKECLTVIFKTDRQLFNHLISVSVLLIPPPSSL
jgi:hypothetical protein